MNYDDMTIEELETLNTQLSNERAAIKARQREINQILDKRRIDQDWLRDVKIIQSPDGQTLTVEDALGWQVLPRDQSADVDVARAKARLEDGE